MSSWVKRAMAPVFTEENEPCGKYVFEKCVLEELSAGAGTTARHSWNRFASRKNRYTVAMKFLSPDSAVSRTTLDYVVAAQRASLPTKTSQPLQQPPNCYYKFVIRLRTGYGILPGMSN